MVDNAASGLYRVAPVRPLRLYLRPRHSALYHTRFRCGAGLVLLALTGPGVWACECSSVPTIPEAFSAADFVFGGQVVNIWPIRAEEQGLPTIFQSYTFRVDSRWKGAPGQEAVLVDAPCSFHFRRGGTYLVFARATEAGPADASAALCSGTRPIEVVGGQVFEELGPAEESRQKATYHPESVAHVVARRFTLARLSTTILLVDRWRGLGDSPAGAWGRFGLQLLVVAFLFVVSFWLWRRQWRKVLVLVTAAALSLSLGLLWWGYQHVLSNPILRHLAD